MEVIRKFPVDMDARTQYKLMKSPVVKKMMDAADSVLEVNAWLNYEDVDEKTGEIRTIVVIQTKDGEMFGTVSPTFIKEFNQIVDFFGEDVGLISVLTGTSKNGRQFITCTVE